MVEAYLPTFGWYPLEPTLLEEAWEPSSQINWCIVAPAYEQAQKAGWRSYIGGGVPYLTCNEINLPRGSIRYVGGFEKDGDNRAKLITAIGKERNDWHQLMNTARAHWQKNKDSALTTRPIRDTSLDQLMKSQQGQ